MEILPCFDINSVRETKKITKIFIPSGGNRKRGLFLNN